MAPPASSCPLEAQTEQDHDPITNGFAAFDFGLDNHADTNEEPVLDTTQLDHPYQTHPPPTPTSPSYIDSDRSSTLLDSPAGTDVSSADEDDDDPPPRHPAGRLLRPVSFASSEDASWDGPRRSRQRRRRDDLGMWVARGQGLHAGCYVPTGIGVAVARVDPEVVWGRGNGMGRDGCEEGRLR
ncbi:hypothetical protein Tdes44962_MAKER05306 [Teratosphaeria destructans]|uniref:Uncharacterized protein n=1 Tax=Teratosphaeria destructans TaxID=418781 RepID=A0A9W7SKC0_9PEZI|nr:hypothetical protein Tdes44962_MAKER05306 [Teratosphaeria destructans]